MKNPQQEEVRPSVCVDPQRKQPSKEQERRNREEQERRSMINKLNKEDLLKLETKLLSEIFVLKIDAGKIGNAFILFDTLRIIVLRIIAFFLSIPKFFLLFFLYFKIYFVILHPH